MFRFKELLDRNADEIVRAISNGTAKRTPTRMASSPAASTSSISPAAFRIC
jgi:hypothetical protein